MENLNKFQDERGLLVPLNFSELPFEPKRLFYISNVPKGTWRGGHAHFQTKQLLICIAGKILVRLESSEGTKDVTLEENEFCLIENLIWDSQFFQEEGSVLLVICSTEFEKEDYITSKEKFLETVASGSESIKKK